MKHFTILLFFVLLGIPSTEAYIITHDNLTQVLPTVRVNGKLALNKETRRIELGLENKVLKENIFIQKNLGELISKINLENIYNFELKLKKQDQTELHIINIRGSRNAKLDDFRPIATLIREGQKLEEKQGFFKGFLHGESGYASYTIRDLPFFAQAPLGTEENWSIHDESCEEAALLMNHYITQGIPFTAEKMDADIQAMNEYQKNHGISEDKYSERFKKNFLRDLTDPNEMYNLLGKKYLGYKDNEIMMLQNPTIEDIELLIQNRNILTIPMKYTKTLRNKFIRAGKSFHIMNIVGYDTDNFYTQDPGTKNGLYLPYPKNQLFQSIQENGDYLMALKKK